MCDEEQMDEENRREKSEKAVGPWRSTGGIEMLKEMGVEILTKLFNKILERKRVPEVWKNVPEQLIYLYLYFF